MDEAPRLGYGLIDYRTTNIGDEIQSVAARRFLPRVDQYVDRDRLAGFRPHVGTEEFRLIMNGWYTQSPANWPPRADTLKPLLVSMHIAQVSREVVNSFLSRSSLEFLRRNGPVGTRDVATREFLLRHDVPAYLSGCLTLTLERDERIQAGEFVLLVDAPPSVERAVRSSTDRPVISASVYIDAHWPRDTRFLLAEYFLTLYQSAHSVVTTRLHTALPCTAFGTPVALVRSRTLHEVGRFSGLRNLFRVFTEDEFLAGGSGFDVDAPRINPDRHHEMRQALVERCSAYTGIGADGATALPPRGRPDPAALASDPALLAVFSRALASQQDLNLPGVAKVVSLLKQLRHVRGTSRARRQLREHGDWFHEE